MLGIRIAEVSTAITGLLYGSEQKVQCCAITCFQADAVLYAGPMGRASAENTPDLHLFREVFNASPIGIAVENLEGQPLFVNPALCSMLGFSDEEMRSKHCVDFSPPEDARKDWELFQQLKAGAIDHYQIEKRYYRRDGSLVWGGLSISLLKNGPSLLVIAMVEDITDKKRAAELLGESEERLQLAVQAGRMFAYSWDAATDVIERSGESAEILGTKKEEAGTGASVLAMVHPDDKRRFEAEVAKISVGNPTLQITYRIVRPDGGVAWLERNSRAHFDARGNLQRIVGMIMDVTERKRVEELQRETNRALEKQSAELQAREELLKIFVKNVPTAVAMLDRDMRYLQVSDRWCADYLPGRAQILGRSHYEIFPDMPERWKEVHCRALQGETLRADEDRWDGQDGFHWARWEVRPWKTAEGAVGGILILAEDITRRKQMEEELSGMSRKLIEAQEQERARIARELHDDVSQRLSMLAIELEQLKKSPSEVGVRVQQLWEELSDISDDVQALSHDLHSVSLDFLGAVAGINSWCREFAERQGMQIDYRHRVQSTLPSEIGLCLFRVLQEALHNAAKYSGVKRIEVELSESSGKIHLTISDLGKGFDVEAVKQGKGLGLTSMRERVRLVNGTMTIDSRPMVGTTIHVRVPLGVESSPMLRNVEDLKNTGTSTSNTGNTSIQRP